MPGEDMDMDAARASFRVAYQDSSHFSREYKRHFGARHTAISRTYEAARMLKVRIESQVACPARSCLSPTAV